MSMKPIIFTHIYKTAGGSFVNNIVRPNYEEDLVYKTPAGLLGVLRAGDRDALRRAQFIYGHTPHGLHRLLGREAQYVTFLRHPVDRAISWYYWSKDLERIDLYRRHPLRNYADSVSIKEFYENRDHSNAQTRFLAGSLYNNLYPKLSAQWLDDRMLSIAKRNLGQYACIGLLERFEESVQLMQHTFGWMKRQENPRKHTTKKRPSLEGLREFDERIVDELAEYHQLDFELYNPSCEVWLTGSKDGVHRRD
jgi:hypothetical protein